MASSKKKASEIAALLHLNPHPDGGFYSETLRDSSVILNKSQLPPTYKVGRPVFELHEDGHIKQTILGQDLGAGQKLQYTVPAYVWFCSYPTLDIESYSEDCGVLQKAPARDPELSYSLVGVTCAPAFQFEDSESAAFDDIISIAPQAGLFLRYLTRP